MIGRYFLIFNNDERKKGKKEDEEASWKVKTEVIPVMICALGRISKELEIHLDKIGVKLSVELVLKIALLGIAKILLKRKRRVIALAKTSTTG